MTAENVLTLILRLFSWELQVDLRVQFNAKQSSNPKRDPPSVTYIYILWWENSSLNEKAKKDTKNTPIETTHIIPII